MVYCLKVIDFCYSSVFAKPVEHTHLVENQMILYTDISNVLIR